jgi:hypothetical protein
MRFSAEVAKRHPPTVLKGLTNMTTQEMVQAINEASQTKPVRFFKKGNGINTEDVVLYVLPEHQLILQVEEGFEVVYLSNNHEAYEVSAEELERAYNKVIGR